MKLLKSLAVVTCLSLGLLMVNFGSADDGQSKVKKAGATKVAAAQKAKAQKKPKKPAGRLPNNYGKIGLSGAQRKKVYAIQGQYRTQIQELQKQIDTLEEKRNNEIAAVLTDSQKEELAKLQAAAKKKSEERKKARSKKAKDKTASSDK